MKINRLFYFISYLFRSFHLHGIHSPFVFTLVNEVLREKLAYYAYDEIEAIRSKLLLTQKKILIKDLGAGKKTEYESSIGSICKRSSQSPGFAQIIHRLAIHHQANNILELGTSMGLTTAYLAKARPQSKIISIEGANELAKIADINHNKLNINNIKLINGSFQDKLSPACEELGQLDLVYFDGHHDFQASLNYFKQCLEYAHEGSLFIFDDIHWSPGMKKAWKKIIKHPKVQCSIDLYQLGLVYFDPTLTKKHHTVFLSANLHLR